MSEGLFAKITNIFMPLEEEPAREKPRERVREKSKTRELAEPAGRPAAPPVLTVHSNSVAGLKVYVAVPTCFDEAAAIADRLKAREAVVISYEKTDMATQIRISDFMNGACYTLEGAVQRISDHSMIYAPLGVEISKELYAYSIPVYGK